LTNDLLTRVVRHIHATARDPVLSCGDSCVLAELDLHTEWLGMDLAWGPQRHVQLLDIESVETAAAAMHRDASSGKWH
jgi:hypothetical protein